MIQMDAKLRIVCLALDPGWASKCGGELRLASRCITYTVDNFVTELSMRAVNSYLNRAFPDGDVFAIRGYSNGGKRRGGNCEVLTATHQP